MKVLEICHLNKKGELLFKNNNINNILHAEGEEFILRSLFGGNSIPPQYYLGLDSRTVLSRADIIENLSSLEPTTSGYIRQTVDSNSFSFVTNESGNYQANSPVVLFRAINGSWGPVRNIFLSNQAGYGGKLISSVPLGSNLIVQDGEIISMRIGLALGS
jgi:hypothetical protein